MKYTKWIARTGVLLALALVVQFLGFPQYITGPLINMVLFISAMVVGWGGVLIGGLTPWIAFIRGILPPPLAPMIPFIIMGNIILVIIYYLLRKQNNYLAVVLAASTKFAVLSYGVKHVVNIPPKVAQMMQLPQLLTALAGGLLALFLLKALARTQLGEDLFNLD